LPAYLGALALSIAVKAVVSRVESSGERTFNPGELSWESILSHALLIHTWVRGQTFAINYALWSVATEWHIYFLFPTILLPIWQRARSAALILTAFAIGIAPLVLLPSGHYLLAACPWYVGLFALGMFGAVVTTSPRRSPLKHSLALLSILVVAAILYRLPILFRFPTGGDGFFVGLCVRDAAVGIAALCLLLYCARFEQSVGDTGRRPTLLRWLESRPAVALGGFSNSLYAAHCTIIAATNCLAGRTDLSPIAALNLYLGVGLPLSIGFAYLFSLWFEVPFLKGLPRARREMDTSGCQALSRNAGWLGLGGDVEFFTRVGRRLPHAPKRPLPTATSFRDTSSATSYVIHTPSSPDPPVVVVIAMVHEVKGAETEEAPVGIAPGRHVRGETGAWAGRWMAHTWGSAPAQADSTQVHPRRERAADRALQTQETGYGCEETRSYIQMPVPEGLPGLRSWNGLRSIGVVVSERVRDGHAAVEVRYYISSLAVGVERFARAIRGHRSIENGCDR
jgi:peptidoglycan/LPS O-acetylase OafA/YrhL